VARIADWVAGGSVGVDGSPDTYAADFGGHVDTFKER